MINGILSNVRSLNYMSELGKLSNNYYLDRAHETAKDAINVKRKIIIIIIFTIKLSDHVFLNLCLFTR